MLPNGSSQPPYVVFATPCFSSQVSYEFAGSMEQTATLLAVNGIRSAHLFQPGIQFIEVARNLLLSKFLAEYGDATDLFFIDDDIGFPAHKVLDLLACEAPVAAGVYPLKAPGLTQFPVFLAGQTGGAPIEDRGLYLAEHVPGGFVRMKRAIVEQLASAASTYQWMGIGVESEPDDRVIFKVFDRGDRDGEFIGEDVMFCRHLKALGIPIWVDPEIKFTHRGTNRWEGTFGDAVRTYLDGTNQVAKVREIRA